MSDPIFEPTGKDDADDDEFQRTRLDALYLLARGIAACTICGGEHRAWQCPQVAAVRAEMEYHARLAQRESIKQEAARILEGFVNAPIWQEAA